MEYRTNVSDRSQKMEAHFRALLENPNDYFRYSQEVEKNKISVEGETKINFGSCSYLGLEQDPRLKIGAMTALDKFGTQFSSSRAFMSIDLYRELHELYKKIFGSEHIVLAPTTTLAHMSAIPVIVDDHDLVIADSRAHNSMQMSLDLLAKRNVPRLTVEHNNVDALENILQEQQHRFRKIWYFADGIYSMSGNVAPVGPLEDLKNRYKNLHFYFDDAHGMTWYGHLGRGYVLDRLKNKERVIVAVSHAKCFGTAGGTLVFSDENDASMVRVMGGPMIFGGPIQPPILGASIACAKIHLTKELITRQSELKNLIQYTNRIFKEYELPMVSDDPTPIRYVRVGSDHEVIRVHRALLSKGFYTNPCVSPAVAWGDEGIRFTVTSFHNKEHIQQLAEALKDELSGRSTHGLSN